MIKPEDMVQMAEKLSQDLANASQTTHKLAELSKEVATHVQGGGESPFLVGLTVFILAVFVGYYVVWKVTPALHSPLMAVTNAISSVIIVGALLAAGGAVSSIGSLMGFIAVVLAAINIFGGFIVTQRMLHMFTSNKKQK